MNRFSVTKGQELAIRQPPKFTSMKTATNKCVMQQKRLVALQKELNEADVTIANATCRIAFEVHTRTDVESELEREKKLLTAANLIIAKTDQEAAATRKELGKIKDDASTLRRQLEEERARAMKAEGNARNREEKANRLMSRKNELKSLLTQEEEKTKKLEKNLATTKKS